MQQQSKQQQSKAAAEHAAAEQQSKQQQITQQHSKQQREWEWALNAASHEGEGDERYMRDTRGILLRPPVASPRPGR